MSGITTSGQKNDPKSYSESHSENHSENWPQNSIETSDEISEVLRGVRRSNVLLVEDSADSRALLSRYITDAGGEVEVAVNGLEGLKKALIGNYDIVLMDIQMPRIDGLDAIRKLRGWGYEGSVVAVTGCSLRVEREDCLRAGFDEYLTKPVNRGHLLYTIACQPRRVIQKVMH